MLAAAVVAAGGRAYERRHLGWDDADGIRRVAGEVQRAVAAEARALEARAVDLAGMVAGLSPSPVDPGATRLIFESFANSRLDAAHGGQISITLYSFEGTPIAWSGRPSDLPRSRLTSGRSIFVAPGPLGPRLVALEPVMRTTGSDPRPAGSVAVERLLPAERSPGPVSLRDTATWPTALVPVELRTRYERAGAGQGPESFLVTTDAGEILLEGRVAPEAVAHARSRVRRVALGSILFLAAIVCGVALLPLASLARHGPGVARAAGGAVGALAAIAGFRLLSWLALPLVVPVDARDPWLASPELLRDLLRSPLDVVFHASAILALGALLVSASGPLRAAMRSGGRVTVARRSLPFLFTSIHLAAGMTAGAFLVLHLWWLRALAFSNRADLLVFSFQPWNRDRLSLLVGLVLGHAGLAWSALGLFRIADGLAHPGPEPGRRVVRVLGWVAPSLAALAFLPVGDIGDRIASLAWPVVAVALVALRWPALARRHRHAAQAARLAGLFVALVLPSVVLYPSVFREATSAKRQFIADRLAPDALRLRDDLKSSVDQAAGQIDAMPGLADLVESTGASDVEAPSTDAAFLVWSQTDLALNRLTSAVELYRADGTLVSRFALNLPEYTSAPQKWQETSCTWDSFEEVSPIGSEERRLLHAGRGICVGDGSNHTMVGAIVIHAMLDYAVLPFIQSQNPYIELLRSSRTPVAGSAAARHVDFAVYGWSRQALYASGQSAWTIDQATFSRIYATRDPFWVVLPEGGRSWNVYFANDRGGIYALGFPDSSAIDHLVNLAELTTLAGTTFVALLFLSGLASAATGRAGARGREVLREIRASFYRKLFLAFVAAALIPVLALALVARAYLNARLRTDVEDAAVRTTAVAQRVVEDYARLQEQAESAPVGLDDDVLVWISRVIGQDVNVFDGARLAATSERDLYASGLLSTRTPADVYEAIALDRRMAHFGEERAGAFRYMVAASPVSVGGRYAILIVPLTLRQQAIEREIGELNRRILLGVLLFILGGAGLGYWMAERIADPVNRLQRATARLASGDLSARVALTSSDELRRLVEAFNAMAAELQRQQGELERTHRLEAWADMARQVAHEIKNPLTPIQLSAEHLRRVHTDRGAPLSPVLEGCIDSILTQVRLLRHIAGEFSSFASSPTPRPVPTRPAELVAEVVEPYRAGLSGRVGLSVDVPAGLPPLAVDRSLVGGALTNLIDNALHAMPTGGHLSIEGRLVSDAAAVKLAVRDTGVGMDPDALAHIFEPYFSTKAAGTGLGLTIAKRNVELHGGAITIESQPGRGTTVTLTLPLAPGVRQT
ncbi:MAG: HAMP domain-containing sensor histidine kinase [Acidobacteriota bacterium]